VSNKDFIHESYLVQQKKVQHRMIKIATELTTLKKNKET
jgi:hypothetical protein